LEQHPREERPFTDFHPNLDVTALLRIRSVKSSSSRSFTEECNPSKRTTSDVEFEPKLNKNSSISLEPHHSTLENHSKLINGTDLNKIKSINHTSVGFTPLVIQSSKPIPKPSFRKLNEDELHNKTFENENSSSTQNNMLLGMTVFQRNPNHYIRYFGASICSFLIVLALYYIHNCKIKRF